MQKAVFITQLVEKVLRHSIPVRVTPLLVLQFSPKLGSITYIVMSISIQNLVFLSLVAFDWLVLRPIVSRGT